ncbi:MAG TPA: TonB-dependent receptor [Stellaceae bacterium]|nr:TonB-dependent receptor [Stellaceae bacterium]
MTAGFKVMKLPRPGALAVPLVSAVALLAGFDARAADRTCVETDGAPPCIQLAQAAPPSAAKSVASDDTGALEEVLVTTNRAGAQDIQKVPTAVTAISTEQMDALGLQGLSDLSRLAPGLNLQEQGPGMNEIQIRGLTNQGLDETDIQDRNLVSVYLDDTPISVQGNNPDLNVYDLERIEVLRGPQGTLYGAGAMAGTVRYITIKPDLNDYLGSVEATDSGTYRGGNNFSFRGMVNIPLVDDKLALRVNGYEAEDSGWINNIATGARHANSDDYSQLRAALRMTAIDNLVLDASITYSHIDANALNDTYHDLGYWSLLSVSPEGFKDQLAIYNVTGAYDFGWSQLTSSTSYSDRNFQSIFSDEDLTEKLLLPGFRDYSPFFIPNKIRSYVEEVRLNSEGDGPLKWIGGIYYERDQRRWQQDNPTANFDKLFGAEIGDPTFNSLAWGAFENNDVFSGIQDVDERQVAVYGEVTYTILPHLDFKAGARYFDWTQAFSLYYGGIAGAIAPGIYNTEQGAAHETGVNPRFNLSYQLTDDEMVFAEAAKGFRYGGVNQPVPEPFCGTTGPLTFGADKLWSYSLGEKSEFLDHNLLLNLTGFYIDWNNVQTLHVLPQCGYYYFQNAGKVQSKGVELETKARIGTNFTVAVNASYTDAEAAEPIPNVGAKSGDLTPFFPQYIVAATLQYVVPLADGSTLSFIGDYEYRGDSHTEFDQTNADYRGIPASNKVNLAVNYNIDNWEVGLFAKNLTDDHAVGMVQSNGTGENPGDTYYYTRPRTIGIRAKMTFGGPAPSPAAAPPAPPPVPASAPPAAPAPEAKREFQVFFDFDKSNITEAAARVVREAAAAIKAGSAVRITVTGHTDTVGTASYNQGLSERRAAAVKTELVTDGVDGGTITTIGVGKTGLLVPTADGVREPQNRRAEIVLQ